MADAVVVSAIDRATVVASSAPGLLGTALGPLRQRSLGLRLNPPADAFDEEVAVAGAAGLPEHFDVLRLQLRHRHPLQGGDGDLDVLRGLLHV